MATKSASRLGVGVLISLVVILGLVVGALMIVVIGHQSQASCGQGPRSASGGPLPAAPAGQLSAGQIVRYFEKAGEPANAAAGIVGNLVQESSLNPTDSDGNGGGGLAQWNATWYHAAGPNGTQSLAAFASAHHAAPDSDQAQLPFIIYDLRTAYSWLQKHLITAANPQTAATMFETGYEDCSGVTGFMQVTPGSLCDDDHRRAFAVEALHAAGGADAGQTGTTQRVSMLSGCAGGGVGTGTLPLTNGQMAKILPDGLAAAPRDAPEKVKQAIAAGNAIVDKFYSQERRPGMLKPPPQDSYDCSGSTDWVLYNAGLSTPQVNPYGTATAGSSYTLETYGLPGPGKWIDVYSGQDASEGHAFIYVAAIILDTSYQGLAHEPTSVPYHPTAGDTSLGGPDSGPRWFYAKDILQSQLHDGMSWLERHPPGY